MRIVIFLSALALCLSWASAKERAVSFDEIMQGKPSCSVTFCKRLAAQTQKQQGCCSHHGGVCGCSAGRDVCCDGAYSPTCRC